MDKIEVTQAIDWARKVASSKPPRYTDASRNAARYILATRTDATPVAWMPIESAPKDGTVVLFATPEPGDWRYHMSRADDRWNGAYWLNKATHWMHLPAAPRGE